ncbi:unnamed protein product [Adineta steineri]|uniref:Uncharacterized protein n=1 Tax=Adineta steineri TaxID=433720 RepID=A0A819AB91_9BILA|nr:unnamed protein product [Adineta steineri]CAF1320768.1 unnamed protein product [Adineta steineri]CAF3782268.1 unnamed protein product [Adineta steineri]CAF3976414.1 unnamed protein product [Adineta steineri]
MTQCFETYKEYACEPSAFLHCVLTTIGSLSDGVLLSNVISHNDMSINLMAHIVGEPGSQKSNLIRVIRHALSTLEIENVHVLSDDIDMFNNSFGIYGEAHEIGSSVFDIKTGTITLLGTSTGDKLWTKYNF